MGTVVNRCCEWCQAPFTPLLAQVRRGRGRYCSRACADLAHQVRMSRQGHPNWGKRSGEERVCKACGRVFYRYPSQMCDTRHAQTPGQYCSQECYGVGKRGRSWGQHSDAAKQAVSRANRGRVHLDKRKASVPLTCVMCGSLFLVRPHAVNTRQYCSLRCVSLKSAQGPSALRPTKIEAAVYEALVALNLPFMRQYRLGRYLVDAYIPETRTVVEAFGDYWHCNPRRYPNGPQTRRQAQAIEHDPRRLIALTAQGYRIIILWEYDILRRGALPLLQDALSR